MASLPHADWRPNSERSDYLYVIVIADDRIKVGRTYSPETRLGNHRRMAEAYGTTAGRQWVSCPGVGTGDNESRLIDFCAARATQRFSREYFAGLTFEEVVEYAEILNGWGGSRRGWIFDPNPSSPLTAFDNVSGSRAHGSIEEAARWLGLSEERIHELMESGDLRVLPGPKIPVTAMRRWLMAQ